MLAICSDRNSREERSDRGTVRDPKKEYKMFWLRKSAGNDLSSFWWSYILVKWKGKVFKSGDFENKTIW
jgi:hypothetical protein